ncbi:SdpI family protein [uncultured Anaerococcus sp.]|uniref:SdpI family protein n=1 Tax=uncultured Anaerococcus sp. TaxID=293428 RepID=UPI00288BF8BA|nr:SdpI family protein [uncultured Anaerococcus sp.]
MFYRKVILFYIPAYLIIIGFVSNKVKDKMNTKYGYRSELSMKNKANWYYANKTMAKMCFGLGGVFLLIGFLIARYMEVTLLRIAILWILEFLAYITGGILLERKLKTIHKK